MALILGEETLMGQMMALILDTESDGPDDVRVRSSGGRRWPWFWSKTSEA